MTIALAALLSSAAFIGGCKENGDLVVAVIQGAQKVCAFVPSVESAISVLAANPAINTAEQAVNMICDGFNSWKANQPPEKLKADPGGAVTFRMFVQGKEITVSGKHE